MVWSTYSSGNALGAVHDNNNSYKNMVIDTMGMNQGHANQYPS
jgi:hypothetical protein